jgi:hypothetical protein
MSFWHFAWAALNAGDEVSTPVVLKSSPRPALGSGKFVTPLARMHLANASGPEPAPETVECERAFRRPEVPVEGVVFDAVVVDRLVAAPTSADVRLARSPPQPATSIALSSVATTSRCTRGTRVCLRL